MSRKNISFKQIPVPILFCCLITVFILTTYFLLARNESHILTTRNSVLQVTPIGTYVDDVLATINVTENWVGTPVNNSRGFHLSGSGGATIVGVKHIHAGVRRTPSILEIIGVRIYWGFDEYGYLEDVQIRRMITS